MLEWTGERFLPNVGTQITYEHYLRYLFALNFVTGKTVLDCPCGEGYGTHMLSSAADSVYGIDISESAISHCKEKYKKHNLKYICASMSSLSMFENETFDVIVCFEGIEHVNEEMQKLALAEFRRLLKKDGVLLMSTPNKLVYSDIPKYSNEYHIKEFYENEFRHFLSSEFRHVHLLGQAVVNASMLIDTEAGHYPQNIRFSNFESEERPDQPIKMSKDTWMYFVAVCSLEKVPSAFGGALLIDFQRRMEEDLRMVMTDRLNYMTEVNSRLNNQLIQSLEKNKKLYRYLSRTVEGALYLFIRSIFLRLKRKVE